MRRSLTVVSALAGGLAVAGLLAVRTSAESADFGLFVQQLLHAHSEQLFGFSHPLTESALGPYDGADNLQAIEVAQGLKVSLVSSSVASAADQIALWPDDENPKFLFVCDEETSTPAVQRVDLSKPPASNATTIVTGLVSCDPVRRTPWGTIIVAEEAGATGGLYEILDPANINAPINVIDRAMGTTSDPDHLVKRKAVGSLSFESFAIKPDGTMIYGDELAPGAVSTGSAGGGIYKFVPTNPYTGTGQPPITMAMLSPLASGDIFGLRVAANGSSNWGQGAEIGKGRWTAVDKTPPGVVDAAGNTILRNAQVLQKFTGYYRPEDMDIDPEAAKDGIFRACWANTGRLNFGGGTTVENSAVYGEVMCLVEEASAAAPTGTIPVVTRFIAGSQQMGMPDNVAFQPHTGNLVVLEDGPTSITTKTGTEPRGNDLWICLPDGDDDDVLTDGCVRFASIRDTSAEPTGFIFTASGESAYVNIQHRAVNDAAGPGNHGALVKISGFKVNPRHHGHDDDDHGHGHD
jgi:secreted PhoX family phosphatase